MSKLIKYLLIIQLLLKTHLCLAGAWLQEAKKLQIIGEFSYSKYKYLYLNNIIKEQKIEYIKSLEYGLNSQFTYGMKFIYNHLSNKQHIHSSVIKKYNNDSMRNLYLIKQSSKYSAKEGIVQIYFRKLLFKNNQSVLSIQPSFSPHQHTKELRILGGHSYKYKNYDQFVNLEMALKHRSHQSDILILDFTHGINVNKNIMILSQLFTSFDLNKRRNKFTKEVKSYWPIYTENIIQDPNYKKFQINNKISAVIKVNRHCAIQLGATIHNFAHPVNKISSNLALWINL